MPRSAKKTPRSKPRRAPRDDSATDLSDVGGFTPVGRTSPRRAAGSDRRTDTAIDQILRFREKASQRAERRGDDSERRPRGDSQRLAAVRDLLGRRSSNDGCSPCESRRAFGSATGGESCGRSPASAGRASQASYALSEVPTLRAGLGLPMAPAALSQSALILIDCQVTYTEGPMKLHKVSRAIAECRNLLERARKAGSVIVHIQHDAGAGSLYDVSGRSGAIVPELTPRRNEAVVVKAFPNSFHNTTLKDILAAAGVTNLIIAGFMTHCCVNSTARAAFNMGVFDTVTVVASATATRVLPDPTLPTRGLDPEMTQKCALAAISELHAHVCPTAAHVRD